MKKVYRTMADARMALALDTGFDPFVSGGWGRCTKEKLAAAGYVVDPKEWDRRKEEEEERVSKGLCVVCGEKTEYLTFCVEHGVGNCPQCGPVSVGFCPVHMPMTFECENGHRWAATQEVAQASGFRCHVCGEHSV
jgi:hypothetical protein